MKVNRNGKDLKITNSNRGFPCNSCAFKPHQNLSWCVVFCRSGKIWIKDICNSDIFRI
jgi:hypothetical protein